MALLKVAANTEENSDKLDDRSVIPAGDYLAHIVKSEMKQTKSGNGSYLSLHFTVLEGEYKGRMVFTNLNLDNPNPVAVEIARKELNSICDACEMQDVTDSEELHQVPLVVVVKIKKATAQWPEGNEIGGYKPESEWAGSADAVEVEVDVTEEASDLPWEKD